MLKNQVIIVFGGLGLIGQQFVKSIIKNNGICLIADINDKVSSDFKNIDFIKLDMTSKDSINNLIESTYKKYGKINSIVNCAYPRNENYGRKFEDVEYNDFSQNLSMHIGGYFLVCQQFFDFFKKQNYGNIINMASIYGVISPRFEIYKNMNFTTPVEYAAIKSAIIHLTKYMAKYFKGYNIRVNCISPGGVRNNHSEEFLKNYQSFCQSKGMLDKEDLNGTLLYLLSDMSKYVNGQNIIVDDGFCL